MLSFPENIWNFKAIRILSYLNFLPLEVNVRTGEIKGQSKKWKRILWSIFYFLAVLQSIYVFGRFLQVISNPNMFRWDHFIIHVVDLQTFIICLVMGNCLFIEGPLEFGMIFNSLFKKPSTAAPAPARRLLTWPLQYSLHELLSMLDAFLIFLSTPMLVAFTVRDPTQPHFLYSSLSLGFQNVWSYSFFGLLEACTCGFLMGFAFMSTVVQLRFLDKCYSEFEELDKKLRSLLQAQRNVAVITVPKEVAVVEVEQEVTVINVQDEVAGRNIFEEVETLSLVVKKMKELAFLIELCNRVFPFCIFAFKLMCIDTSILGYFFFICYSTSHPFLAVFMIYCASTTFTCYTLFYGKAFAIPEKMENVKSQVLVAAQKIPTDRGYQGLNVREIKREMMALRDEGIKVGSFCNLERTSTLDYIDFVVQQVVGLLVSFPA